MDSETLPTSEILKAAKEALTRDYSDPPQESIVPEVVNQNLPQTIPSGTVPSTQMAPAPPAALSRFGNIPQQLRENSSVNLFEIKRRNLAAALETLERSTDSHEGFPTPEAGFAVADLSEQVLKLTRDLEKSQDPYLLADQIKSTVLQLLVERTLYAIASELKSLREHTIGLLPEDKLSAYRDAVKNTLSRISPACMDALEEAEDQLHRVLNIKVKEKRGNP